MLMLLFNHGRRTGNMLKSWGKRVEKKLKEAAAELCQLYLGRNYGCLQFKKDMEVLFHLPTI